MKFKGPGVANLHGRFISPLETGQSRPLATVWSEIEDREEQDEVLALLKALDPEIVDIRIGADELGRASLRVHHARLGRMPLEFLGGGFGKALAIACHILAIKDGLLMIDEFDASLHVGAQTRIIEFLLEAAERHNVQVCASTHSSETLDAFLDAYAKTPKLFKGPAGLQVVQLKRTTDGTRSKTLDAERAKHLREEIGLDLRRTG